jgi:hypothetical protein
MALRGEIVDLVRLRLLDDSDQVRRIGEIAMMEHESAVGLVRILVEVIDPVGIDRRASLDAVDQIALGQKELRQIGTVLASNSGNECNLRHLLFIPPVDLPRPRVSSSNLRVRSILGVDPAGHLPNLPAAGSGGAPLELPVQPAATHPQRNLCEVVIAFFQTHLALAFHGHTPVGLRLPETSEHTDIMRL